MPYDLSTFDLGDMLKCSPRLRETSINAPTLESSAQRVCRFFYDELRNRQNDRQCALVRCYKTHQFGALPSDLQNFAQRLMGGAEPQPTMRCLTLMATVGQAAAWNSTSLSKGHRAIPLPRPEIVEKAPMIAQLIKQMGLELSSVLEPSPEIVRELAGKRHGVFHVQDAFGSPYIPAQDEFVRRFGINSVVGFGGMLPSGDFFSVILFSTVSITPESADRFKTLALDVKTGFSRFNEASIFNSVRI
jgi:hypothetical protein